MFYYLYQITNNLNGKIYVGVHKTKNLDDGYMGSGKVIRSAITKHGIENFTKVILEQFENASAMYAKEKEVVNESFLARDDTYNLRRGGTGGFDYINAAEKNLYGSNGKPGYGGENLDWTGVAKSDEHKRQISRSLKNGYDSGKYESGFKGRHHSDNTKAKMSKSSVGKSSGLRNSQFGSMWITNGLLNKKIVRGSDLPSGWMPGRTV